MYLLPLSVRLPGQLNQQVHEGIGQWELRDVASVRRQFLHLKQVHDHTECFYLCEDWVGFFSVFFF